MDIPKNRSAIIKIERKRIVTGVTSEMNSGAYSIANFLIATIKDLNYISKKGFFKSNEEILVFVRKTYSEAHKSANKEYGGGTIAGTIAIGTAIGKSEDKISSMVNELSVAYEVDFIEWQKSWKQ